MTDLTRGINKQRAFSGIKVWSMAWIGVGPITARYLADNGAHVVRMDSANHPDLLRAAPPFKGPKPGLNNSMFFGDFNCSKLSLGLNMKEPEAREIAFEMAQWADVVLESFTPGTMAKWGLSYAELSKDNPGLIMLSTCMQGQTGPRAAYPGYGNLMASMSGFYEVTGWPDRDPVTVYGAYTDFIAPRFTAMALIAALDHKRRTGEGQYIDVSQYEASLQFFGSEFLDYEVNDAVATRQGNHHQTMCPHGVYPCRGEESWLAISVESDDQWLTLKSAMGNPPWAESTDLNTALGRKAQESLIDEHISQWTATQDSDDLFQLLQPAVAAGPVYPAEALYKDQQIEHRDYFQTVNHPVMDDVVLNGAQANFSSLNNHPSKAPPCVGENSVDVLKACLGMADKDIATLIEKNVVQVHLG